MTPSPQVRSRVALAALALVGYAACGDQPAAPQHTPFSDGPKANHRNTDQADREFAMRLADRLDGPDHRIRLVARATRSTPKRTTIDPPNASGDVRNVTSTAYCLTGTMANGQRVHHGAAAMNGVPLGSVWQVDGGGTYTVADRIGSGSQFDIAMPGDCAAARAYGRRTITIRRVG